MRKLDKLSLLITYDDDDAITITVSEDDLTPTEFALIQATTSGDVLIEENLIGS